MSDDLVSRLRESARQDMDNLSADLKYEAATRIEAAEARAALAEGAQVGKTIMCSECSETWIDGSPEKHSATCPNVEPAPAMTATYTCEACGGMFVKGWSDEEARAEQVANGFDVFADSDCAIVCDDCYRQLIAAGMPVAP